MTDEPRSDGQDISDDPTVEQPTPGGTAPPAPPASSPPTLPATIGPFRILGKLGEGGMGVVYEAEQDQPKRRVALKVIRAGAFAGESQIRMFQREADMLARLKHPGIADIYQVGETDEGQPYFVMELIRGKPLDEYLAAKSGPASRGEMVQRLQLLRQICDAVHYAHQRGIIHRDLKPSNVLVVEPTATESTGTGGSIVPRAKILDFGLARITDADATQMTEVGMIKGTLQYMSPEQTRGRPEEIDIRADVYALGVILYEALSGKRPYDLKEAALVEAMRVICEKTPEPLTGSWSTTFRPDPDLETIVRKALEKEPDRRYSSVAAFSEDIERFMESQPILARPPSAVYQIRKMVTRHRGLFGLGAAMLVLIVAASIISTVLYVRAERSAARATLEASKSSEVARFMTEMLQAVGPAVARGRDTSMLREILDDTVVRIDEELDGSPEVAQTLQSKIAETYFDMSELEAAERVYRSALEKSKATYGPDDPRTLTDMHSLAVVLSVTDASEESEALFNEALEGRRRALGPQAPDVGSTLTQMANLHLGQSRYEEAENEFLEALEILRAAESGHERELGIAMNSLANLYHNQARYDEAEALYREAEDVHTHALGEDHPDVLVDRHNIASLLRSRGDLEGAERIFLGVLEDQRRILGEEHRDVATVIQSVGRVRMAMGDYPGAEARFREALEMTGHLEGEDSTHYADMLVSVGDAFGVQGQHEKAEEYFRRGLAIRLERLGPNNEWVGLLRENLASTLITLKRYDEADSELKEALRIAKALHGEEHPSTVGVLHTLGRLQRQTDQTDLALDTLGRVLEIRLRTLGPDDTYVGVTRQELGRLLIAMGGDDNVAQGEQLLRDSIESYIAARGEAFPAVAGVRLRLGKQLSGRGAYAEAEPYLLKGHEGVVVSFGADHAYTVRSVELLVELYERWGKPDQAAEWRSKQ